MRMTTLKTILPLALLALSIAPATARDETESYKNIERLEIDLLSGSLVLTKSKTNEVVITADDDQLDNVRVRGNRLIIDGNGSRRNRRGNYSGFSGGEWVIAIPDGMEVDFNTASGDLEVSDVSVEMDMNTGSGDIDIDNSKGEFHINTGSGDIHTETVTFLDDSGFSTGSGRVTGRDITLEGALRMNTGSGDVKLSLSSAPTHDISLNSGSGDATLNLNGAKLEGTLIMTAGVRSGEIEAPFEFDSEEVVGRERWNSDYMEKIKEFSKKDIEIKIGTGSGTAKVTN